jgi:hypothetical protein
VDMNTVLEWIEERAAAEDGSVENVDGQDIYNVYSSTDQSSETYVCTVTFSRTEGY